MSYIKWNKALTNYFFNDINKDKEVILYADKNLINEIGRKNSLGNYQDFVNSILIDFDSRCSLYDELIANPRRAGENKVKINKELKNKIKEFPNHLASKTGKFDLVFFNYIVFYITVFVDNTKEKSFYKGLNSVINNIIRSDNNTQPLNGLDDVFKKIEEWSIVNKKGNLGIFRARKIGSLAYLGLLKYQVVLKPIENKEFEKILYEFNIKINDNTLFAELANRLLPLIIEGSLRRKIIEAPKNIVYAEWFLNRVKNFNHDSFGETEVGKKIKVKKKGQLAFYIDPNDFSLKLKINIEFFEDDNIKNYYFTSSEKDENGYFIEPLFIKSLDAIKFEQKEIITDTLDLKTLKINEVNFFQIQGANGDGYIQTLTTTVGYDYLVLVKNNNLLLEKWHAWASNENNIEKFTKIENSKNLINLFGMDYDFYTASNIKNSFYKNDGNEIIYSVETDQQILRIKNIGGYQISNRTYIDTALPHFEVKNTDIDINNLKIKVYRNGCEDPDIIVKPIKNNYYLFLNENIYIYEASLIIVKFTYSNNNEVQFDFSIVPSKIILPEVDQLFKCNKWGEILQNEEIFFNGLNISNTLNSPLANNIHKLEGLKEGYSFDFNYFIYILTSVFNYNEEFSSKRNDLNKAIDSALIYLRSKGFIIKESKYSKTNLINNLYALGYINKSIDAMKNSLYQLMPPTIVKIEKSFDNNTQVFKLVGARTKLMIQKTIDFCNQNNIVINFKVIRINNNELLENILLPETIFIDLKSRVNEFVEFIKNETQIEVKVEDQYHIGDSLVNFIASVSYFEEKYLTNSYSLENQEFNDLNDKELPYLVESKMPSYRNSFPYFVKYLKTAENSYFKDLPNGWGSLYVEYKKKNPVLLMQKKYGDNNSLNFYPEVLIPSKIRLPLIIYKALVAFNHGIPKTVKVFIKNIGETFNIENQFYMFFDQYNISQKAGRQENIAKIITGSSDLLNNTQIVFNNNSLVNKNKMSFAECTLESDLKNIVIIKNDKAEIIAIGSNYKKLYLNKFFISDNTQNRGCEISLNNEIINVIEIDLSINNLNKSISTILDNQFSKLSFLNTIKKLNVVIKNEESIIIKELQ